MLWLDKFGENLSRGIARNVSRRSSLALIAKSMVGSAFIMPVLPIARAQDGDPNTDWKLDTKEEVESCDYWRHCGVDGFLCGCCGGSPTSCGPGAERSPVSWVGTCHNPKDGKDYMVSYHDCCGKNPCGRCYCFNDVGERPGYQFFRTNDVNWCIANKNLNYHCTVSIVLGPTKYDN